MNSIPDGLYINWCSHDAAKFACENWHYSKCLPKSKINKIGIWEDQKFIGVVLFSVGSSPAIGKPFDLNQIQICELTRVALREHKNTVTKIISKSIKLLKNYNPGLKLIVSYSDPFHNHLGKIYQAGNWIYVGVTHSSNIYYSNEGKLFHSRHINDVLEIKKDLNGNLKCITLKDKMNKIEKHPPKFKYLYPLDDDIKLQLEFIKRPYPKNFDNLYNKNELEAKLNNKYYDSFTPFCYSSMPIMVE
jgi:hypothetical protein